LGEKIESINGEKTLVVDKELVKCIYCTKTYEPSTSTGTLGRHLEKHGVNKTKKLKKEENEKVLEKLIQFVSRKNLSLNSVYGYEFQEFCKALNKNFILPGPKGVKSVL